MVLAGSMELVVQEELVDPEVLVELVDREVLVGQVDLEVRAGMEF